MVEKAWLEGEWKSWLHFICSQEAERKINATPQFIFSFSFSLAKTMEWYPTLREDE